MLVTELPGRLRIIRNGKLDPQPISGWPVPSLEARSLNSVLVHPQFAQNHFVYLSYSKGTEKRTTIALARGRLDGTTLTDVKEIFVADAWGSAVGQQVQQLADGEVSPVFQSDVGFHMIKRLAVREQDVTEENRRNQAREIIGQRKADEAYERFLRQIRAEAYVESRLGGGA